MSTHFIEEADVLGDRIFIMAKGQPRCYGTPIYLKNLFGFGYQLRIAKDLEFNQSPETRIKLQNIIRQHFQNSTVMSENVGEIIYQLDQKDASHDGDSQSSFAQFFTKFEEISASLHVSTFGVSAITLEDVFLKILYMSNQNRSLSGKLQLEQEARSELQANLNFDKKYVQITKGACGLWLQKFRALIIKRLHHSKRYYPTIIFQLIIPFVQFFLIFTLDSYLRPNLQKKHELHLNLFQLYGRTSGFFKDNTRDPEFHRCYSKVAARSSMTVEHLGWGQNPSQFIAEKSQSDTLSKFSRNELFGAAVRRLPASNSTSSDTLNLDLEVYFNNEANHALPLSLSAIYNSLFEYVNDLNVSDYNEVKVINQPFPNPVALVNSWRIIRVTAFLVLILSFDLQHNSRSDPYTN